MKTLVIIGSHRRNIGMLIKLYKTFQLFLCILQRLNPASHTMKVILRSVHILRSSSNPGDPDFFISSPIVGEKNQKSHQFVEK